MAAKPQKDDLSGHNPRNLSFSGHLILNMLAMLGCLMFKGSLFNNMAFSGTSSLLASNLVFVGGKHVTKALEASHFSLVMKALEVSHFSSFVSCALIKKALTMCNLSVVSLLAGRLPAFIGCHPSGLLAFVGCHAFPFSQVDVLKGVPVLC